jgi:hypothetical protein
MAGLNQDEIDRIMKRPAERRYEYFVKKVADSEEVFGLADDEGWALLGEGDSDALPLFPFPEFAEAFNRAADWSSTYEINVLDLNELLEWLDDMEKDGMKVAVFPNAEFNAVVMEPQRLKADLQAELEKYDEDGKRIQQ